MGRPESSATLVELLQYRAQHQPKQRAYTFLVDGETDERNCTYEELAHQARAIGASLRRLGAEKKNVLLLYPPGPEFMPAFWGCVYAGAVPVPAYPPRANRNLLRLQSIIVDAEASLVLTTPAILSHVKPFLEQVSHSQKLHCLTTESLNESADYWQPPPINKDSLALIQYTSGSTGNPRGVMLSHENLLQNAALVHKAVAHEPGDRYVSWLPIFHDMGFMAGILQPLYAGLSVVLMSPVSFLQRPVRWLQAISRYRATTSGAPNFAYEMCVRKISAEQITRLDLSSWTVAFNGAELIRKQTLEVFAQRFASCGFSREAFYPCYGLAEATLMVSAGQKSVEPVVRAFRAPALERGHALEANDDEENVRALVGCGRSMPGQEIVIAHPELLTACAEGEVGEIWIKGKSVAGGYWNRPDETQRTFQAYLKTGEGPFLRTGDLGFLSAGELFVTGRLKDLIIIRGRNHYPEDIEYTVERCRPELAAGGVAAFSVEVADEERLVVLCEVGSLRQLDPGAMTTTIRQVVSDAHELQTYAVVLLNRGSIPKTSSGKIQRHACRDHFSGYRLNELFRSELNDAAVESAAEEVRTLQDLLAIPSHERYSHLLAQLRIRIARSLRLAPDDLNPQKALAAYGLDSLTAIELKYELESEWKVLIPFETLLLQGSVAGLAALILDHLSSPAATAIDSAPVENDGAGIGLSHVQQALWFLYQLAPESSAYNIASAFRGCDEIDVPALRFAFQSIINRHSALRTTYSMRDGQPRQYVNEQMEFCFTQHDASSWPPDELHARLEQEANEPFNLVEGPVFRVHLFTRSQREHVLLLVVHHIAFDGWSFWLLLNELNLLYHNGRIAPELRLLPPARPYTDYVRWQAQLLSSPEGAKLSEYWRRELGPELLAPSLPTKVPRSLVQAQNGDSYAFTLSKDLVAGLRQFRTAESTTLYTILVTAFQILLRQYTGEDDFVIGTVANGRTQPEFGSVIGCLMNPIGLRCDMSGDPDVKMFIAHTQQRVWRALDHQHYPSQLLAAELQLMRVANRLFLYPVMFIMQKSQAALIGGNGMACETGEGLKLGELELGIVPLRRRFARSELELEVVETDETIFGEFHYNTELFDESMIGRMAAHYAMLLESIVSNPQQRLSRLQMLTKQERQQLLIDWTHDTKFNVETQSVHGLFDAQVEKTPDKAAAVYDGFQVTFLELQERANKLASLITELKNDRA